MGFGVGLRVWCLEFYFGGQMKRCFAFLLKVPTSQPLAIDDLVGPTEPMDAGRPAPTPLP